MSSLRSGLFCTQTPSLVTKLRGVVEHIKFWGNHSFITDIDRDGWNITCPWCQDSYIFPRDNISLSIPWQSTETWYFMTVPVNICIITDLLCFVTQNILRKGQTRVYIASARFFFQVRVCSLMGLVLALFMLIMNVNMKLKAGCTVCVFRLQNWTLMSRKPRIMVLDGYQTWSYGLTTWLLLNCRVQFSIESTFWKGLSTERIKFYINIV